MDEGDGTSLLSSVTEIVSVYLHQNSVEPDELGQIITSVTEALRGALTHAPLTAAAASRPAADATAPEAAPSTQEQPAVAPAVPVDDSIHPDYLVCLECGAKQKTLKRHLASAHALSPQEYRQRWGLDRDYPVTALNYAEARRETALRIGLGRGGRAAAPVASKPMRKGRGRPKGTAKKVA
jgi:predicted transcriptional regulator